MITVREFAEAVLSQIGQANLTDEEAATMPAELPDGSEAQIFKLIAAVLNNRSGIGNAIEKLNALAVLNDIHFEGQQTRFSDILIGGVLE